LAGAPAARENGESLARAAGRAQAEKAGHGGRRWVVRAREKFPAGLPCQRKVEMSGFPQSRNVRFFLKG
jgi:hypothetical protein